MAEAPPEDHTDSMIDAIVKFKIDSSNPFQYQPPKYANTVMNVIRSKNRSAQVEAVLEMIDNAKRENIPRGLVLNDSVVTADKPRKAEDMVNVKRVLGEGNSAGEVIVAEDAGTGKEYAMKMVLITQFNKDEIRAWVHLADLHKAPELYSFYLEDNQVVFKMEILKGETLKSIFKSQGFQELLTDESKSEEKKCFSLLLLHGMLENFELLKKGKFTHGDGHSGNTIVSPALDVLLIDFGSAKNMRLAGIDHACRLKADIVNIIRQFCHAFTGVDFSLYSDAQKALELKDFRQIRAWMPKIPEVDRKWLFDVMSFVFDTVRDQRQEGYADTTPVTQEVEAMLPERRELEKIKSKLAALLFPEKYKNPHHDPEFAMETETESSHQGGDPIFDDPDLADLATLVDLKKDFGESSLF